MGENDGMIVLSRSAPTAVLSAFRCQVDGEAKLTPLRLLAAILTLLLSAGNIIADASMRWPYPPGTARPHTSRAERDVGMLGTGLPTASLALADADKPPRAGGPLAIMWVTLRKAVEASLTGFRLAKELLKDRVSRVLLGFCQLIEQARGFLRRIAGRFLELTAAKKAVSLLGGIQALPGRVFRSSNWFALVATLILFLSIGLFFIPAMIRSRHH